MTNLNQKLIGHVVKLVGKWLKDNLLFWALLCVRMYILTCVCIYGSIYPLYVIYRYSVNPLLMHLKRLVKMKCRKQLSLSE